MEAEEEFSCEAELLRYMSTTGELPASMSNLTGSSRGIPSEKDFFFYKNFQKFKAPINRIENKSTTLLSKIGSLSHLWEKQMDFPECSDYDDLDAFDWVVNANDDIFEKLDKSLDEFRSERRKNLSRGKAVLDSDGGFQVVHGRKNRKGGGTGGDFSGNEGLGVERSVGVVEIKAKAKVPFHIATIPRPQDAYKIIVNNSNQPFEHVWLQRAEDGSRFVHPLENLSVLDFVDKSIDHIVPVKPPPIELTPFKLVEEVKDLKQLVAKLRAADEFAVDLEHNQYRSFQGLTCLMQISTRTEDFVIDTLKLRIHVGPYLREVFKDPTKRKVMHGADRDIIWLQRDFGIYVCNMFDTGQASRVLKLERNSLEYLLQQVCGVTANKEYQNADWRIRPLPDEMLRYAREDTHYLLYIYDVMRINLLSASSKSADSDDPLVEVYKRSYDICMQLYEKELLTDCSFLHVYGLQGAGLNAQQLAVVAGLCEWRDAIARAEDESTGYVLPNKTLIEIAKQMPLSTSKLQRLVKVKHPYVERNLGSVVSIIRHSIQSAPAFEAAAEQLKERQIERLSENASTADMGEVKRHGAAEMLKAVANIENKTAEPSDDMFFLQKHTSPDAMSLIAVDSGKPHKNIPEVPDHSRTISCEMPDLPKNLGETGATIQVLKKPSHAFGALLGSSTRRKLHPDKKEPDDIKLEKIRSLVNLPFHSFAGVDEQRQSEAGELAKPSDKSHQREPEAKSTDLEQIITLGDGSDAEESVNGEKEATDVAEEKTEDAAVITPHIMEDGEEAMSLSDLSSSFQKCFQSTNQTNSKAGGKSVGWEGYQQFKAFDYETAKKEVNFGEDNGGNPGPGSDEDSSHRRKKGNRKSSSFMGLPGQKDEGAPPQGRRRQAFPASGNRSATFR